MSDDCSATHPSESIELNGHRYILESALASWSAVEVMVRNPAVSERIADLEARLEKAEEERDQLVEQQIAAVNDFQTARNDALEEAAAFVSAHSALAESVAESLLAIGVNSDPPLRMVGAAAQHKRAMDIRANAQSLETIATAIRALKEKP
jgi:hypothetical protein